MLTEKVAVQDTLAVMVTTPSSQSTSRSSANDGSGAWDWGQGNGNSIDIGLRAVHAARTIPARELVTPPLPWARQEMTKSRNDADCPQRIART